MWVTHPSFKGLVHTWWNECDGGWGGFCFMKKLVYVKRKLLKWNGITFGLLKENKNKLCVGL